MKAFRSGYGVVIVALTGMLWASVADAVPSFGRQTGKSCSYCHDAWPQLNSKGRAYKELGYRFPDSDPLTFKEMMEDNAFPISGFLVSRPYDKKDSGDRKLRALHEVEVIVAGGIGENWSGYVELEAEDETDFDVEVAPAVLGYNYNQALNVQMAWAPFFWSDPYGFLGDHFRETRGHVAAIDQKFGGADGKLRDNRQNITAYGRLMDRFFYSVGYAGESKDSEGVKAGNILGRIAFDITDDIMIGGFAIDGEADSTGLDYKRYGLDFQGDLESQIGVSRLQAGFVRGEDDVLAGTGEEDNDVWSVQFMHFFATETGKPTWVPIIRYESYEKNDGKDSYDELTLNLTRYIGQNAKAYIEYWDRVDSPSDQDDDRLTVQISVGF